MSSSLVPQSTTCPADSSQCSRISRHMPAITRYICQIGPSSRPFGHMFPPSRGFLQLFVTCNRHPHLLLQRQVVEDLRQPLLLEDQIHCPSIVSPSEQSLLERTIRRGISNR